jgi:protein gp37
MANRLAGRFGYPEKPSQFKVTLHPDKIEEPLHWKNPQKIFLGSMTDIFHIDVPFDFLDMLFYVMAMTPQHTYQVLTKRAKRMRDYLKAEIRIEQINSMAKYVPLGEIKSWPLPNVWVGTSIEDQKAAEERIPALLETPSTVRFLSCEPLLGPVDLVRCFEPNEGDWDEVNYLDDDNEPEEFVEECEAELDWVNYGNDLVVNPEYREWEQWRKRSARIFAMGRQLDWVICGGESGPGARPMHPDWARAIQYHCQWAKVPFFFKQWGEWSPDKSEEVDVENRTYADTHGQVFYKLGKKAAGCLLDGKEYKEFPGVKE